MATRLVQINMKAQDDSALGGFWAEALGWGVSSEGPGVPNLEPEGFVYPDPVAVCLDLIASPEPKTVKNRVHVDLATTSAAHQAEVVTRLKDLGATPADVGQGDVPWTVMADPEGNEFCVLDPPTALPRHRTDRRGSGRLRGSASHGPLLGQGHGLDPARGDRPQRGTALRQGRRPISAVPPHSRREDRVEPRPSRRPPIPRLRPRGRGGQTAD